MLNNELTSSSSCVSPPGLDASLFSSSPSFAMMVAEVLMKVFDAHFDLLGLVALRRNQGKTHVFKEEFYPHLKKGRVKFLIASLFLEGDQLNDPFYSAMEQIGSLHEELRESPELIMLIKTKEDLSLCLNSDKIGILLSFEGAEPLKKTRDLILFHALGVRLLGLSWSRRNIYADGCDFEGNLKKGGLSKLGFELIELARELGIIIDASHLSQESFEDVLKLDIPFIASHSNAYTLTPSPRCILDKDLDILRDRDFCLGINGAHFILTRDKKTSSMEDYLAHLDYMIQKLGPDKVGIGLDLCDYLEHFGGPTPGEEDVIPTHSELPQLIEKIQAHFGKEQAEKIAMNNWLNFFKKHL